MKIKAKVVAFYAIPNNRNRIRKVDIQDSYTYEVQGYQALYYEIAVMRMEQIIERGELEWVEKNELYMSNSKMQKSDSCHTIYWCGIGFVWYCEGDEVLISGIVSI